jgi:hypothetical protein
MLSARAVLLLCAGYAVAVIPAGNPRAGKPVYTGANGTLTVDGLDPGSYFLSPARSRRSRA